MLHFISMFAMYGMILDEEKYFPLGLPVFIASVFLTGYIWVKNNKKVTDYNKNLITAMVLFNIIGTLLLMGFGIILTMPITMAYCLFLVSIPLLQKSFCQQDTPLKVSLLSSPPFLLCSFISGLTYWETRNEEATDVFLRTFLLLSIFVFFVNYKIHRNAPPQQLVKTETKSSIWV